MLDTLYFVHFRYLINKLIVTLGFNSEVWKWKKVTGVRVLQSGALDVSPLLGRS